MTPKVKDNASSKVLYEKSTMLTISKTKTIDKVVVKFIIKTLPTISVELYYESLNEIIQ